MPSSRTSDPVHLARSAIATAARLGQDQTPARRDLATAKLRRAVSEALSCSTPPSIEAREEIAELLTGGAR